MYCQESDYWLSSHLVSSDQPKINRRSSQASRVQSYDLFHHQHWKNHCFMQKTDRDIIMSYDFHNRTAKRHLGQFREKWLKKSSVCLKCAGPVEIIPNNTFIIQSRCVWRFFLRTGSQLTSDNIQTTTTIRAIGSEIVDQSQSLFYSYLRNITVKLARLGWKKPFEVVGLTRIHLKMEAVLLDYYFQAGLDYKFQSRFPNISGDLIQYWGSKVILGSQSESQRTIWRNEMSLNI